MKYWFLFILLWIPTAAFPQWDLTSALHNHYAGKYSEALASLGKGNYTNDSINFLAQLVRASSHHAMQDTREFNTACNRALSLRKKPLILHAELLMLKSIHCYNNYRPDSAFIFAVDAIVLMEKIRRPTNTLTNGIARLNAAYFSIPMQENFFEPVMFQRCNDFLDQSNYYFQQQPDSLWLGLSAIYRALALYKFNQDTVHVRPLIEQAFSFITPESDSEKKNQLYLVAGYLFYQLGYFNDAVKVLTDYSLKNYNRDLWLSKSLLETGKCINAENILLSLIADSSAHPYPLSEAYQQLFDIELERHNLTRAMSHLKNARAIRENLQRQNPSAIMLSYNYSIEKSKINQRLSEMHQVDKTGKRLKVGLVLICLLCSIFALVALIRKLKTFSKQNG